MAACANDRFRERQLAADIPLSQLAPGVYPEISAVDPSLIRSDITAFQRPKIALCPELSHLRAGLTGEQVDPGEAVLVDQVSGQQLHIAGVVSVQINAALLGEFRQLGSYGDHRQINFPDHVGDHLFQPHVSEGLCQQDQAAYVAGADQLIDLVLAEELHAVFSKVIDIGEDHGVQALLLKLSDDAADCFTLRIIAGAGSHHADIFADLCHFGASFPC